MAWNESFNHELGGGWGVGEASFSTAGAVKDSATTRLSDRLAVPATISDLYDTANQDEKYVLGDYSFGTVCTVGIVKSYSSNDSTTSYIMYDPENLVKEYNFMIYHGLDQGEEIPTPYVEGTRVMAFGKLRYLNGEFGVMTFNLLEIINDNEYKAFTLEAKLAKIYFGKDIFRLLQSGKADMLNGYCVGAPAPNPHIGNNGQNRNQPGTTQNTGFSQQSRIYNPTPVAPSHGMVGQRGKILELLEGEKHQLGENGMNIDDIKMRVGALNMAQLRSDLDFLVSEGHIYATINDDNFAVIG